MTATTGKGNRKKNKWEVRAKALKQTNGSLKKELVRAGKRLEKLPQKSKEIKLLRMEVKRLRANRDSWREKSLDAQKTYQAERVKRHPYCLALMSLGALLHIDYGISLRATAKALRSVGLMFGQKVGRISSSTIRNWSLRLGLYFLTQRIPAGRYALIADESISMGQEKLLVLLLVRVDSDQACRVSPLSMSDVKALHVQARASWKGADISSVIKEKLRENQGLEIAYAISDKGSNLLNGFGLCGIKWVGDCTHTVSNCTQGLFQKGLELNELVKAMNGTWAKWALSGLSS